MREVTDETHDYSYIYNRRLTELIDSVMSFHCLTKVWEYTKTLFWYPSNHPSSDRHRFWSVKYVLCWWRLGRVSTFWESILWMGSRFFGLVDRSLFGSKSPFWPTPFQCFIRTLSRPFSSEVKSWVKKKKKKWKPFPILVKNRTFVLVRLVITPVTPFLGFLGTFRGQFCRFTANDCQKLHG